MTPRYHRSTLRSSQWPPVSLIAYGLFVASYFPSFSVAASTERDITIKNNCDYTLWPAITSGGEIQDSKYTGKRGWEAKAGSEEQVKVPGIWHGMIWARRSCSFDAEEKGKCLSGDNLNSEGIKPPDIFEPKANFAEFLFEKDAVVDRWHISCWNGWTVTMSVEPGASDCASLSCATDLNESCPDDKLKQLDSDGKVIGCHSACSIEEPVEIDSVQCCTGKYDSPQTCLAESIDYYPTLKPYCLGAYWYFWDNKPDTPSADHFCPSEENSGYTITFCPDGETTTNPEDETWVYGDITFGGDEATPKVNIAQETGIADTDETITGDKGANLTTTSNTTLTPSPSSTLTSSAGGNLKASSSTIKSTSPSSSPSGTSSESSPSSSNSSNEESSSDDALLLGYPQSTVLIFAGGIIAVLAVGIGLCCCLRSKGGANGSGGTEMRSLRKSEGAYESESESSVYSSESEEETRNLRHR